MFSQDFEDGHGGLALVLIIGAMSQVLLRCFKDFYVQMDICNAAVTFLGCQSATTIANIAKKIAFPDRSCYADFRLGRIAQLVRAPR